MELYTLDSMLRREKVIDRFESLIWTERFKDMGDFELTIDSSQSTRSMFHVGDRLALNESYRVMNIDTIEDKKDDEGRALLTVTGRSMEAMMEDRIATSKIVADGPTPNWVLTGTPGNIARQIFKEICVDGRIHVGDILPYFYDAWRPPQAPSPILIIIPRPDLTPKVYPTNTIPEPTDIVTIEIAPDTVYASIKQICDIFGLGFRASRFFDDGRMYFEIYSGSDRTTQQSVYPPVVFSPELDNLTDITELKSVAGYKNTAYVYSDKGSLVVYGDNVDPRVGGFERRVLKVDATDLGEATGAELTALLKQRGQEALAEHRTLTAFDGVISEHSSYKYGRDYHLGDMVEMQNTDGAVNNMRVEEQIFVSDSEGERSYPTLSFDTYITPGAWRNWDYNQVWETATKQWVEA